MSFSYKITRLIENVTLTKAKKMPIVFTALEEKLPTKERRFLRREVG
jgi:hypothetical protein